MEFITNLKRSTILILSLVAGLTCSAKDKQRTISVETADMNVKVEFYSPEIVRVVKQPKGAAPMEKKSFSVILHPGDKFGVDVDESTVGDGIPVAFYSLSGTKLAAPQRGFNIVKYSNGLSKKVLIP